MKKALPDVDPIVSVNNFIIYWFLFEILIRYFMQQLPVMNVKPLMTIPIKRNTVIHYLLGKTTLSFFNFLSFFLFFPFAIVLLVKGYPILNVGLWFIAIIFLTLSINYLNFLVNKSNTVFYLIAIVLLASIGLEYYKVFKISEPIGIAFNALYSNPLLVIIPMLIVSLLYYLNFKFIRNGFYLDDAVSKKIKEVNATDLSWMNRFGSIAPFLKNDMKLIWRNARPKQVMMMSFLFLFYGLIFYTQEVYREMPAFLAFASMFVTGGFLMTFGQLVPSWDSEYYKLLMSQNIPYKKYLESKWYLMVVEEFVIFTIPRRY